MAAGTSAVSCGIRSLQRDLGPAPKVNSRDLRCLQWTFREAEPAPRQARTNHRRIPMSPFCITLLRFRFSMKSADNPDQKKNWQWHAKQPQQKISSHEMVLQLLAARTNNANSGSIREEHILKPRNSSHPSMLSIRQQSILRSGHGLESN